MTTTAEQCLHFSADEGCNGKHHHCPNCSGEVPCAEMGPDRCAFEAAAADRQEKLCRWMLARAHRLRKEGLNLKAAGISAAVRDLRAGRRP